MKHLTLVLLCATSAWCSPFINSLSALKLSPRIINGDPAQEGQFPWQVGINIEKVGGNTICGGTLISNKWILTAGHCVQDATSFQISLGSNKLIGQDNNRVVLDSTEYIVHEQYDWRTLNNDIGVIELPETVTFNEHIKPISLYSDGLYQGSTVTVSGWGLTSDSATGASPILNYATLTIVSTDDCVKAYGGIPNGVYCAAGGFSKQSTCEGDSGGPLVAYINNVPYHVGLVSFGHPDGCESGYPVAFTRTDYFRDWIKKTTGV